MIGSTPLSADAAPAAQGGDVVTLIDELLAEQRRLTAVERFSRQHALGALPLLESHYRDLIPLTAPRPGEQYAFEVDLDSCSSCQACVSACHALNGLDEGETWRSVGFLRGSSGKKARARVANRSTPYPAAPLAVAVTTACHHCVEPACLLGCPVLAYDKDPATGIVRHLDDQCIGCSYCVLKCPYDVPKYSEKRGIVRKCDLCQGRLADGEAPACVQACPSSAIRVTTVDVATVRALHRGEVTGANTFLAASPDPAYTLPTSRYITRRGPSELHAADEDRLRPEAAHWPLVWMLVLTQVGIGVLMGVALHGWAGAPVENLRSASATGMLALVAGLIASVFHLGRPLKAWRVWMGWRTSWLSREAIALNAFAGVATMFAQAMVYVDTRRTYWSGRETGPRFVATVLQGMVLGAAVWPGWVALAVVGTVAFEWQVLAHRRDPDWTPLRRTAGLLVGPLHTGLMIRLLLAVITAIAACADLPLLPFSLLMVGTMVSERRLFFRAVSPDRMPGQPS